MQLLIVALILLFGDNAKNIVGALGDTNLLNTVNEVEGVAKLVSNILPMVGREKSASPQPPSNNCASAFTQKECEYALAPIMNIASGDIYGALSDVLINS